MSGNVHITDAQVEAAAARMRKIIEAAENSNQAGEDALIRADAAGALYAALEQARRVIAEERQVIFECCTIGPKHDPATLDPDDANNLKPFDDALAAIDAALAKANGKTGDA